MPRGPVFFFFNQPKKIAQTKPEHSKWSVTFILLYTAKFWTQNKGVKLNDKIRAAFSLLERYSVERKAWEGSGGDQGHKKHFAAYLQHISAIVNVMFFFSGFKDWPAWTNFKYCKLLIADVFLSLLRRLLPSHVSSFTHELFSALCQHKNWLLFLKQRFRTFRTNPLVRINK